MLVDGPNILIRAAKATERVPLSADGVPTAALLVFANCLSYHVRAERPDALVVCWDGGRSEYRTALYPAYKAGRPERTEDEDTRRPFGLVKRFLTLAGVQHVERAGWEADDLIARYWQDRRDTSPRPEVVIVSSDHDLLQLLDPGTTQVKVSSRPPLDRWDHDRVVADLGCEPSDLPRVMALRGDPGDGVPGLRGVGPKRAVAMMAAAGWQWPTLVASLDVESRDTVLLSFRLVDLRGRPYGDLGLHVALPGPFRPTEPGTALWADLRSWLDRYQMRSVVARLLDGTLWRDP